MVPRFLKFARHILGAMMDGGSMTLSKAVPKVVETMGLSEEDCAEKTKSGNNTQVRDRTRWAMTHLAHAGLIRLVRRGEYEITDDGRKLYESGVEITKDVLMRYPSYFAFNVGLKGGAPQPDTIVTCTNIPFALAKGGADDMTPTEAFEAAFKEINESLAYELIERIKSQSPRFFERLVVDLLVKMGYGGKNGFAETTQYVKDGGIDGIISEDKLGLSKIYVQAKRWDKGNVGYKEITSFIGALAAKNSKRGVFITTSQFTKEAQDYVANLKSDNQIVLVDGRQLAEYMIEFNVGVAVKQVYELKRIDLDYFEEEE